MCTCVSECVCVCVCVYVCVCVCGVHKNTPSGNCTLVERWQTGSPEIPTSTLCKVAMYMVAMYMSVCRSEPHVLAGGHNRSTLKYQHGERDIILKAN